MNESEKPAAATHAEICNMALRHYERISTAACDWCNTVPRAIEFYKKYGPSAPPDSGPTVKTKSCLDMYDKITRLEVGPSSFYAWLRSLGVKVEEE